MVCGASPPSPPGEAGLAGRAGLRRRHGGILHPDSGAAPLLTSTIFSDCHHSLPPTGAGLRRRHGGILHPDSGAAPLLTSIILSDCHHSLPPTGAGLRRRHATERCPHSGAAPLLRFHRPFLIDGLDRLCSSSRRYAPGMTSNLPS